MPDRYANQEVEQRLQELYERHLPLEEGAVTQYYEPGRILAAIPGKMGIGVFSPGLDPYGNSVRGVRVCEEVSGRLGLHVFATEAEDAMLGSSERSKD